MPPEYRIPYGAQRKRCSCGVEIVMVGTAQGSRMPVELERARRVSILCDTCEGSGETHPDPGRPERCPACRGIGRLNRSYGPAHWPTCSHADRFRRREAK